MFPLHIHRGAWFQGDNFGVKMFAVVYFNGAFAPIYILFQDSFSFFDFMIFEWNQLAFSGYITYCKTLLISRQLHSPNCQTQAFLQVLNASHPFCRYIILLVGSPTKVSQIKYLSKLNGFTVYCFHSIAVYAVTYYKTLHTHGCTLHTWSRKGATAEYKPHAGLDTSLYTSTSLIQLTPSWSCYKSIIMWMAMAWIRQSPPRKYKFIIRMWNSVQCCQGTLKGRLPLIARMICTHNYN